MTCRATRQLINRVAGNSEYRRIKMDFWNIYHNHYERVRKFIFALVKDEWVADDLIQETFIKVKKKPDPVERRVKAFFVDFQNCLQPLPGSLSQNEPIIEK